MFLYKAFLLLVGCFSGQYMYPLEIFHFSNCKLWEEVLLLFSVRQSDYHVTKWKVKISHYFRHRLTFCSGRVRVSAVIQCKNSKIFSWNQNTIEFKLFIGKVNKSTP